jgi:hypothetical protein
MNRSSTAPDFMRRTVLALAFGVTGHLPNVQ